MNKLLLALTVLLLSANLTQAARLTGHVSANLTQAARLTGHAGQGHPGGREAARGSNHNGNHGRGGYGYGSGLAVAEGALLTTAVVADAVGAAETANYNY